MRCIGLQVVPHQRFDLSLFFLNNSYKTLTAKRKTALGGNI